MKKILLIATGGTIASTKGKNGLSPTITASELIGYLPALKQIANIDVKQILNIDSTNISPANWQLMAREVQSNYDNYDGFVITHGTDTMAYTGAMLSYMIQNSKKPIVITGSQKPIDLEITDAKTNLLDSVTYASSNEASGVVIVFHGNVIAGTRAKKTHTKSYNAFKSINFPNLATIREGKIYSYSIKKPRGEVKFYLDINNNIGLFKLVPGVKSDILDYYFEHHDGIVIESFGTGGIPSSDYYNFYDIINKWKNKNKTLVICTQVMSEGSDMNVYKVGKQLKLDYNLLESYDMTLEATITKLMWILSKTNNKKRIEKLFYKQINYDILYND